MANLLALDQSSHTTGYAIFSNGELMKFGHFNVDIPDLGDRLVEIRKNIIYLIETYNINEVIFEDIQLQDINGNKEAGIKTFKILAEVFGVITELFAEIRMPYNSVLPIVWKATFKIAGKGRKQEKKLSQALAQETYSIKCTEDEADAICIGMHYLKKSELEDFDWSD